MNNVDGKYCRIAKRGSEEDAEFPTPASEDFEYGELNPGVSLPNEYWAEGIVRGEPVVGQRLVMERHVRNGEKVLGAFTTSPIKQITETNDGLRLRTINSVYILTVMDN